jgi:hypothetical protein
MVLLHSATHSPLTDMRFFAKFCLLVCAQEESTAVEHRTLEQEPKPSDPFMRTPAEAMQVMAQVALEKAKVRVPPLRQHQPGRCCRMQGSFCSLRCRQVGAIHTHHLNSAMCDVNLASCLSTIDPRQIARLHQWLTDLDLIWAFWT